MNKSVALFISNKKYTDAASAEGGVKQCTKEYIDLIKTKFDVVLFPLAINSTILYRIKNKLGLNVYNDYRVQNYKMSLQKIISENDIKIIFLNLTNTIHFSKLIKKLFPAIKVILCSHGNESGDFLHEIVLHKNQRNLNKCVANYALGKMLCTESENRKYIDMVLTVSEVELNLEKWLGAKKIYMVPRSITGEIIDYKPVSGRIGFFGDLTHAPNYHGIKEVCFALRKLNVQHIELRLIGTGEENGNIIQKEFPFVKYHGYLTEQQLAEEASTWTFSINPVFYYSRGVSTKLGKALGWGLPVITSKIGMRGYKWKKGEMLSCETADEMATIILQLANNLEAALFYRSEGLKVKETAPRYETMMNEIYNILEKN